MSLSKQGSQSTETSVQKDIEELNNTFNHIEYKNHKDIFFDFFDQFLIKEFSTNEGCEINVSKNPPLFRAFIKKSVNMGEILVVPLLGHAIIYCIKCVPFKYRMQIRFTDFFRTLTNSYYTDTSQNRHFIGLFSNPATGPALLYKILKVRVKAALGFGPPTAPLQALSYNTKISILKYLNARDILKVSLINSSFKELMGMENTWRDLFVASFKHPGFQTSTLNWKVVYFKKLRAKLGN